MQFPRLIHLFHLIPPVASDAVKVDGVESDRITPLKSTGQIDSFVAAICQRKIYYVNVELTQHVNSQGGPIHR